MEKSAVVLVVLLKVLMVIRTSGTDDVVSNDHSSLLDEPRTLHKLKIWQVEALQMIDEDHIKGSFLLEVLYLGLKSSLVDSDPVAQSCMLVNLFGNLNKVWVGVNSMNDCF